MTQPPSDGDFLTVQVAGEGCEPERLLLISRPVGRRVQVREWATGSWNAEPLEREVDVEELFDAFQRAANARRKISQELYYIRTWLDGTAP
jgi:hypothetical protein